MRAMARIVASIRRAPMIVDATPGRPCTHASATDAGLACSSLPMAMSSSMIA